MVHLDDEFLYKQRQVQWENLFDIKVQHTMVFHLEHSVDRQHHHHLEVHSHRTLYNLYLIIPSLIVDSTWHIRSQVRNFSVRPVWNNEDIKCDRDNAIQLFLRNVQLELHISMSMLYLILPYAKYSNPIRIDVLAYYLYLVFRICLRSPCFDLSPQS